MTDERLVTDRILGKQVHSNVGDLPESGPLYVTVDEACAHGRMCRSTLHNLRKAGKIKYIKVGRKVLIDRSSIDVYFASLMVSQTEPAAEQEPAP